MITCIIKNNVLVVTKKKFYSRKIPLKKLLACQLYGKFVHLHFVNEKRKWEIIIVDKFQFNKIVPQLKQHPNFIYATGSYTFYINIETLTKVDVFIDDRNKPANDYKKLFTIQFTKNGDNIVKQDYKHKVFIELTFASKLCIELYPNSLKKALENHSSDLTDKAKAVLDFLKNKNIEHNVMHVSQS